MCHKIMVFYTIEIFRIASLSIPTQKYTVDLHFRTYFNSGSKFANVEGVEGAGRCQNRFREREKLFWGASRK